jgi:hypothetical protein
MKVVDLDEGHNFHVDGISNFEGKNLKNPFQGSFHCLPKQADIQSWHSNIFKSRQKNPI